jgi:hypothetical protein
LQHRRGNKVGIETKEKEKFSFSPLTPCASINQQRNFLLIFLCASFGYKSRHGARKMQGLKATGKISTTLLSGRNLLFMILMEQE